METLGIGLHFEDLTMGRQFRTIGRTVTETDIVNFVNATGMTEVLFTNIEAQTVHLRTFAIDPTGRLLIAASILPMAMRDGSTMPAALVVYRIGSDGKLTFASKVDEWAASRRQTPERGFGNATAAASAAK